MAALAAYVWLGLPGRGDVRALAATNPGTTGVMRQREKEAREADGRTPRRQQTWIPIGRVSRHLVHAVLSSEDQKFFGHEGVDWDAIEKAAQEDRKQWRLARGGSTITQQLAKNLFFTTHKSPVRKLRELFVARWLEEDLTKRRILELYLNVIEWGDGVYGARGGRSALLRQARVRPRRRRGGGAGRDDPQPAADQPARRPPAVRARPAAGDLADGARRIPEPFRPGRGAATPRARGRGRAASAGTGGRADGGARDAARDDAGISALPRRPRRGPAALARSRTDAFAGVA